MQWSMLMNSAASVVRGIAAIVEMAQIGQAVTGSVLQSTQCCQVCFQPYIIV
jgi:hypothetical protein